MSLKKEAPSSVTLLQAVIFLQFGLCLMVTVFTTIGLAFGYPVASHYLMALLQVIVAIPGIVYVVLQGNIWIAVYVSLQMITATCEVYWLVYMIFDQQPAGAWLGLAAITAVNILAIVVALWFRQTALKVPCKKNKKIELEKKDGKPELKVPSTSMSEIEKSSKNGAKKSTSSSSMSNKKSPARSSEKSEMSEKSSKGSLKSRKVKRGSMPLDSRETTSLSRSSNTIHEFDEK